MKSVGVSLVRAHELFSAVTGQYVWFVRCSEGRILRMEFGEPYLSVQKLDEPSISSSETVNFIANRRLVVPVGQWSLFIEDGLWCVNAGGLSCNRTDPDMQRFDVCLGRLSGQKLSSAIICHKSSTLHLSFDLGAAVQVEFHVDFEDNCQWILFSKDRWNLAYCSDRSIEYESQG